MEKRTRYLSVNQTAKEQAGIDTNWSVKAYSLIAAALNAIYKANQITNSPFELEIVLKLAHLLRSS